MDIMQEAQVQTVLDKSMRVAEASAKEIMLLLELLPLFLIQQVGQILPLI